MHLKAIFIALWKNIWILESGCSLKSPTHAIFRSKSVYWFLMGGVSFLESRVCYHISSRFVNNFTSGQKKRGVYFHSDSDSVMKMAVYSTNVIQSKWLNTLYLPQDYSCRMRGFPGLYTGYLGGAGCTDGKGCRWTESPDQHQGQEYTPPLLPSLKHNTTKKQCMICNYHSIKYCETRMLS